MKKSVVKVTNHKLKKQLVSELMNHVSLGTFDLLTSGQYAQSSLVSMTKDWRLFLEFCLRKQQNPLPATSDTLLLFVHHYGKKRKYSSIKRYCSTISLVHKILFAPDADPVSSTRVRCLLSELRIEKKGDARSTIPMDGQHLNTLQAILTKNPTPKNLRNLAIYTLMFETAMRRSELKSLCLNDVHGSEQYSVTIGEQTYNLSNLTSNNLSKWLQIRGDQSGAVFCAIDKHGNLSVKPLDDSSIYRLMREVSTTLGVNIKFSGHSLRVGAVRALASKGMKISEIQKHGRWLSPVMPYQYLGKHHKAEMGKLVFKKLNVLDE